jgi:hypothetical protein
MTDFRSIANRFDERRWMLGHFMFLSERLFIPELQSGREVGQITGDFQYVVKYSYAFAVQLPNLYTHGMSEKYTLLCTANRYRDSTDVFAYPYGGLRVDIQTADRLSNDAILSAMTIAARYALSTWLLPAFEHALHQATSIIRECAAQDSRIIPAPIRRQVFERDGYQCVYCRSDENLQIDHVYPWSKGGTHDLENLQVLCRSCNIRKGASLEYQP